MENLEIESARLEEKIMGLFEKAMSSPEGRFEVFESLGGVTLSRPLVTDPLQVARSASGYEILEGIANKVLDGQWRAVIEEDISGKCRLCIIDYIGR